MRVSLNPELFAKHYKKSLQQPSSEVVPKVFQVNEKWYREFSYHISGITYCTKIPYDENWDVYIMNFGEHLIVAEEVED